jgi:hypothetical protein
MLAKNKPLAPQQPNGRKNKAQTKKTSRQAKRSATKNTHNYIENRSDKTVINNLKSPQRTTTLIL